jgi:hypothetical protein
LMHVRCPKLRRAFRGEGFPVIDSHAVSVVEDRRTTLACSTMALEPDVFPVRFAPSEAKLASESTNAGKWAGSRVPIARSSS